MPDPSRRSYVQAKLKELIERASSVADANLHRSREGPDDCADKEAILATQRSALRLDIGRRLPGKAVRRLYSRR
jgi:hypothetical protein